MDSTKECISCKHFAQGENSSYCANEKQTDEDLKNYVYYNFGCNLHDVGKHETRKTITDNDR
jgi:hypothetical protein